MKLLTSSVLFYAWSDTRYLLTLCIQPKGALFLLLATQSALLHSSLLEGSHAFVSTICSSIVITMTVFLGVRFCLSHKLQLSSCFRNISLCIFFLQVSFFPFPLTSFFNLAFSPCWFTVFFNSFSIQ